MQRIAFTMRIRQGMQAEYRRRHRVVWPALLTDLTDAGCRNYSIYMRGEELFAYMQVEDFSTFLQKMATSEASSRWEQMMSDILIRDLDSTTGFPPTLEEVFHLD